MKTDGTGYPYYGNALQLIDGVVLIMAAYYNEDWEQCSKEDAAYTYISAFMPNAITAIYNTTKRGTSATLYSNSTISINNQDIAGDPLNYFNKPSISATLDSVKAETSYPKIITSKNPSTIYDFDHDITVIQCSYVIPNTYLYIDEVLYSGDYTIPRGSICISDATRSNGMLIMPNGLIYRLGSIGSTGVVRLYTPEYSVTKDYVDNAIATAITDALGGSY